MKNILKKIHKIFFVSLFCILVLLRLLFAYISIFFANCLFRIVRIKRIKYKSIYSDIMNDYNTKFLLDRY
jgi:membrane glycosyltransferase